MNKQVKSLSKKNHKSTNTFKSNTESDKNKKRYYYRLVLYDSFRG